MRSFKNHVYFNSTIVNKIVIANILCSYFIFDLCNSKNMILNSKIEHTILALLIELCVLILIYRMVILILIKSSFLDEVLFNIFLSVTKLKKHISKNKVDNAKIILEQNKNTITVKELIYKLPSS